MKTIRMCFLVSVLFCCNSLFAQQVLMDGYIFPQFEKGIVFFKDGQQQTVSLNYYMLQEKMFFLDADGTILEILKPLDIHAVVINNRRFFPASANGIFYEEVEAGNGSLFIKQKGKMTSQGKATSFGGYSQTISATSYTTMNNTGSHVDLSRDEKFKFEVTYFFYLKFGNSYKNFHSAKTLGKLFKGHESEINEFANEQSIDFNKSDDVARIVKYAYSLTSNP